MARDFLASLGSSLRQGWGLGATGRSVRRRLADQAAVDSFVGRLSADHARELAVLCSAPGVTTQWRARSEAPARSGGLLDPLAWPNSRSIKRKMFPSWRPPFGPTNIDWSRSPATLSC